MPRRLVALAWLLLSLPSARAEDWVPGVTAVASSEQVANLTAATNLVNTRGFTPSGAGFHLTKNAYADGGCMWQGAYLPSGPDEGALVDFDLGKVTAVRAVRVWNHNATPHRGFAGVGVYASDDGLTWRTAGRVAFPKAPGRDDYAGDMVPLPGVVAARFVRFWADSTHRAGGQPDLAGLGKVRFIPADAGAKPAGPPAAVGPYPADSGAVDVTRPPYSATGDGVADDTAALRAAVKATQGTGRVVYLPAGTYRVTDTIRWTPGTGHGRNNVTGAGPGRTVVRLTDKTFTDAAKPKAVLDLGHNGNPAGGPVSADWFFNHVQGFTVHTGAGNPGAVGVRFYSNNVGLLKDVHVTSGDGAGVTGVDLGHVDQNGPLLVRDVAVTGFDVGMRCGATVNSQTVDGLTLTGQRVAGVTNGGQCLTLSRLTSTNAVPAVKSEYGVLTLLDATLTGRGDAGKVSAVTSGEVLFARSVSATGYARAVESTAKTGKVVASPSGQMVGEYVSHAPVTLDGAPGRSLNLPAKAAPPCPDVPPGEWANVRHFRRVGDPDDTLSVQRAVDSGARVVYFAPGPAYRVSGPVEVCGRVERVAGLFAKVVAVKLKGAPAAAFRVAGPSALPLHVEDLLSDVPVENPSGRTLVCRNGELSGGTPADRGELFLENVVGKWTVGKGQRAWAWQLNAEDEGVHVVNAGGTLRVVGLKTERGGVLIDTLPGGRTEVLGGLCYTTTKGKLGPMFRTANASVSATLGEVCYTGDPFAALVESTRAGATTLLKRGDTLARPAWLQGSALPLVRAGGNDD